MASNPPTFKTCCSGVKHEGQPRGKIEKLVDNIDAYITGDEKLASDNVLLILPDVYGCGFVNTQLIADSYAEAGFYTVAVDLFEGAPLEYGKTTPETFQTWFPHHGPEKVTPIVEKAYEAVTTKFHPKNVFSIGYCFGGRYVVQLLGESGKLTAGAAAHPSFIQLDQVKELKGPLYIGAAETDAIYTDDLRHQTEATLKDIKADYHTALFSGVSHGFAIRGDPEDKKAEQAKNKLFADSVWWFNIHAK